MLDGKDFAGLVKDTETNNYGIRYTELIAPLIKALQEATAKIETLETENTDLKNLIKNSSSFAALKSSL